jgi:hypothetical protein
LEWVAAMRLEWVAAFVGIRTRMVSEFHARGGQVTICPPPDDSVTDDEPGHGKRR